MDKCFSCKNNPKHKFRDCVSSTCICACAGELFLLPKNELVEDVSVDSPLFMKIPNAVIKKLPDLAKLVTEFNKIDHNEWLPKREDRRFTSKRKHLEHHNA